MTRSHLSSSILLGCLVVLGSNACSFSFKSGSSSSTQAGKPAHHHDHEQEAKPSSKPIAKADPAPTDEPAGDEPGASDEPGPARVPPSTDEPPPVVEPQLTAVCRTEDESLAALCHRAFDPIAANDLDAFTAQLSAGVVLTRPAYQADEQRLQGPQSIAALAGEVGGLRSLLHLRSTDRVVVTVANDCRACRRSAVAFETNSRSGTVQVTLEMTQPPKILSVDITSQVRRRHLGQARDPQPAVQPAPNPTVVVPPKDAPSTEVVAPTESTVPSRKKTEQ